MDLFTRADLRNLLADHEPPCVSLFMPSHRGGAEEDRIRFRKLVNEAQEQLVAVGMRSPDARDSLKPLRDLLDDSLFWSNLSDGLAVFRSRDFERIYRLPWTLAEQVDVGGTFVVTPLLPLLHGDGRFYILAVSQNSVRLLQGTRFTVQPIDLKGAPKNLAEALRFTDREEVLTFHTRPTSGGTWAPIFEGQGVGVDDEKDDLLEYFRGIDNALHAILREEKAPLVLASVEYFMPIYRQASTYPYLLNKGITGNPDRLSDKELHARAWELVAPHFEEAKEKARLRYDQAAANGKATSDVRRVVPAAVRGEIETLFVALGRQLRGKFDSGTGAVVIHDSPQNGDVDLVNLSAVHALRHNDTVYALEPAEMPDDSPLAGVYHLPLPKHRKGP